MISVIIAYFAAMIMAGNIQTRWLAFAICPVVASGITLAIEVLAWGFTGNAMGSPFYLLQTAIMNTLFLFAFLALGYWLVSRRKARSEDRALPCRTARSDHP